MKVKVNLREVEAVKKFISIVSGFESDMDLNSTERQFKVDAKSIMGIFSLDLSKDLTLEIHDENEAPAIIEAVKEFTV